MPANLPTRSSSGPLRRLSAFALGRLARLRLLALDRFGRRWLLGGAVYVAIIVGLMSIWEIAPGDGGFVAAAVFLTLPFGIAGFVGVYALYVLLQTFGKVVGADSSGGGQLPGWFTTTDAILVVVLFAAVAGANLVTIHDLFCRCRAHRRYRRTGQRH